MKDLEGVYQLQGLMAGGAREFRRGTKKLDPGDGSLFRDLGSHWQFATSWSEETTVRQRGLRLHLTYFDGRIQRRHRDADR